MGVRRQSSRKAIIAAVAALLILLGVAGLALEVFTLIVRREADRPLPPHFGNFPAGIAQLAKAPAQEEFSIALAGDTRSLGTFETIAELWRTVRPDLVFLLGDCALEGDEESHRYFRAECHEEYAQACPVFYVVGNHDVSMDRFPVERFEQLYGPSIFRFVYQNCLFVVLRVLDAPFTNEESMRFLDRLSKEDLTPYRYRFVFMHIPPPVGSGFRARTIAEGEQLVSRFEQLGMDYVFAGDYHGYARVKAGRTDYIISGGGGARLAKGEYRQFHHSVIVTVGKTGVTERLIVVPGSRHLEDRLERLAIVKIDPFFSRHRAAAVVMNGLGLAGFLVGIGLWRRVRW